MDLLLIILLVLILYWRTMDYQYLIDDIVRRWGFLLEIPETSPNPEFFSVNPPKSKHLFLTLTHCVNVSVIYFLWGWKAALLFAVNPFSVSCTAWVTGGYYQITTFLTLTAYFFLVKLPGIYGGCLGALFFTAALGSTINCLAIPFIFFVYPPLSGLALLWPLAFYLFGRRFRIGFNKRDSGKGDKFTIRKFIVMPKVLAYYIKNIVVPLKMAFFREYGFEYGKDPKVKENLETVNQEFWESIIIVSLFIGMGFWLSPFGILFFLAGLLPFTQWKVLGQFVAERYVYLPLVGYVLILDRLFSIHPLMLVPFFALVVFYIWRSHKYIPAFKNIETLYENGIEQFPKCTSNYVNLAERKLHLTEFYEAYKLLKRGLEFDPKSFLCHANMAAYWLAINQPEMGKYHTITAIRYSDNRGMAYNVFKHQLTYILGGMKKFRDFEKEIQKITDDVKLEIYREETEKLNADQKEIKKITDEAKIEETVKFDVDKRELIRVI